MKLCKYYQLLDDSSVYTASLVLNPAIKERHFDKNWRERQDDWISKTKNDIQVFWTTEYKNKMTIQSEPELNSKISKNEDEFDEFEDYIYDLSSASTIWDEYESYCQEKPLSKAPPHLIQY